MDGEVGNALSYVQMDRACIASSPGVVRGSVQGSFPRIKGSASRKRVPSLEVTPKLLGGWRPSLVAANSKLPKSGRRLSDHSSLPAFTSVSSHPQPTNSLFSAQALFLLPRHTQAHRSLSQVQHALLTLGHGRPQHATSLRDCRIAPLHHPTYHPPNQASLQQTWTTLRPTSWSSSYPLASRHSRTSTRSYSGDTRRWSGNWLRQEIR